MSPFDLKGQPIITIRLRESEQIMAGVRKEYGFCWKRKTMRTAEPDPTYETHV